MHRELTVLGVKNEVVAPQKLAGPRRQKTDALDARALVDRLDRWLRGNRHAFSIVRVPTPAEEQARAQVRLRDHLGRMRRMAEGRGRYLRPAIRDSRVDREFGLRAIAELNGKSYHGNDCRSQNVHFRA